MFSREVRNDGAVSLEVGENFVRLFWIEDVSGNRRKSIKASVLKDFTGKLVIDYRRKGSTMEMNDMVVILDERMDASEFMPTLTENFKKLEVGSVPGNLIHVLFSLTQLS